MSYIADIIDAFETKLTNREVSLDAGMNTQIMVKGIVYKLTSNNGHTVRIYEGDRLIAKFAYTPDGEVVQDGGYRKRRSGKKHRSTRRRTNKRRSTRRNK